MSERYSRLFALPTSLYAFGAPVMISAGALLKDDLTGKVLAQLKFRNLSTKCIKAATVRIQPMDIAEKPLGNAIDHQYLDLSAGRNEEFGAKIPIHLPDAAARSYSASILEIIFADNTGWKTAGEPWDVFLSPTPLEDALGDSQLVKQYQLQFGAECKYLPSVQKDLWYCACGQLNHNTKTTCSHCNASLSALQAVDMVSLKADRDARVSAEAQAAAETKAAITANAKKFTKLALIIVPILVVGILLSTALYEQAKTNREKAAQLEHYNSAIKLLEDEQYDEAIAAFTKLGEYRDSAQQLLSARQKKNVAADYADAKALMDQGSYLQAHEGFIALGEYKDSPDLALECEYQEILSVLAGDSKLSYAEAQNKAYEWFSAHTGYKDSAQYLQGFVPRCVGSRWVHNETKEISSESSFVYDAAGQLTRVNSEEITQEKYGNWYVCRRYEEGTDTCVQFSVYYMHPYTPYRMNNYSVFGFGNSRGVSLSLDYSNDILTLRVSTSSDDYEYSFASNGNYRYTKKSNESNNDFYLSCQANVTLDSNDHITSDIVNGSGTTHDGAPYSYQSSTNYGYNEQGDVTYYSNKTAEIWSRTETQQWSANYNAEYDDQGNLLFYWNPVTDGKTELLYAYVYCPDAE